MASALTLAVAWPGLCAAHTHDGSSGWTHDLWILGPLTISLVCYVCGFLHLWRRSSIGRPRRLPRALAYIGGWLALALSLLSPFHELAEELFTCHMVEHEIVMAIAAPLFVLAQPAGIMLWGWPQPVRHWLVSAFRNPWVQSCWSTVTRPVVATILHGAAIWLWHWPALFDAAVTHLALHRWQHVSFFVTALLFWYSLLRTSRAGEAVWHLFFTMVHTSVLGALIAVSPRVLYAAQTAHSLTWGLSPLEDQQLAGIFMWVPAGTLYAGAALAFAAHWIRDSRVQTDHALGRPLGTPSQR